jgi:hypothetical protein
MSLTDGLIQRIGGQAANATFLYAARPALMALGGSPTVISLEYAVRTSPLNSVSCPTRPAVVAYAPAFGRRGRPLLLPGGGTAAVRAGGQTSPVMAGAEPRLARSRMSPFLQRRSLQVRLHGRSFVLLAIRLCNPVPDQRVPHLRVRGLACHVRAAPPSRRSQPRTLDEPHTVPPAPDQSVLSHTQVHPGREQARADRAGQPEGPERLGGAQLPAARDRHGRGQPGPGAPRRPVRARHAARILQRNHRSHTALGDAAPLGRTHAVQLELWRSG